MPYCLLSLGCLLLFFSVLILNIPMLSQFDLAIVSSLSQHRTATFTQISSSLSLLGSTPFALFFATLWCFYLAWYKKYSKILLISFALIGSMSCIWLLKYLIARPRPPEIYHLVDSYGSSFPSAHSAYAATLACLVIFVSKQQRSYKVCVVLATLWILAMGSSRVYLGVHYPSDVMSGWGISFIWISILYLLSNSQFCPKNKILNKHLN
jgi:undecaprenyl-diphosphatase